MIRSTKMAVLLLSVLLLASSSVIADLGGRPVAAGATTQADGWIEVVEFPRLAAAGVSLPMSWYVHDLATFSETGIKWDTVPHAQDDAYRHTALSYFGKTSGESRGKNYAYIIAPSGAHFIYFKAYAISEGVTYWCDREYVINYERLINMGATESVQDSLGRTWATDGGTGGVGAGNWFVGGQAYADCSADIAGTDDDNLYCYQRVGLSNVHFYVGEGTYEASYEVELHFAELQDSALGDRVFDVFIEGEPVLTGLDIYREVGHKTAYVRTFSTVVRDTSLDVDFVGDSPLLCAVRVRGLGGTPQFQSHPAVQAELNDTFVVGESGNFHHNENIRVGHHIYDYDGGLQFQVNGPDQGSLIREAKLHVCAYDAGRADLHLMIYGEDTDDAPNFLGLYPLVPHRTLTDASVAWDIEQDWHADQWVWSPDIAPILQEIVDRPGWRSGNHIAVLILDDSDKGGYRDLCARDAGADKAAVLHIVYVPEQYVPTPTPTPTATATATPTPTLTATPTSTPTLTLTPTATPTHMPRYYWLAIPLLSKR
jgi:hypothetical protein